MAVVKNFNELITILESDSTDNTYKYALLRAVCEVTRNNSHLKDRDNERIWFPTGLLVEKWLLYYWNIFEKAPMIPQMPKRYLKGKRLAISFRKQFEIIIEHYRGGNGVSQFYSEYLNKEIPTEINDDILDLMKKIGYAITRYPMKHLGYSVHKKHYAVFDYIPPNRIKKQAVTRELVIRDFGKFSMSSDYYHMFDLMGGFITGSQSIISQWSVKTERLANNERTFSEVYDILIHEPTTKRQVDKIKDYYHRVLDSEDELHCVWSGKSIKSKDDLNIDHMIPFAKMKNNDLWNLIPTYSSVNSRKKDRIPSPELLQKRKKQIINHWQIAKSLYPNQFQSELQLSLMGFNDEFNYETVFEALISAVDNLIIVRKHRKWNG
jgi:hypothetical protein